MAKFMKEAARVKQVLSANSEFFAQIEGVFEEQDFRAKVSRVELEEMCQDLLERVPGPVEKALKSSQITLVRMMSAGVLLYWVPFPEPGEGGLLGVFTLQQNAEKYFN